MITTTRVIGAAIVIATTIKTSARVIKVAKTASKTHIVSHIDSTNSTTTVEAMLSIFKAPALGAVLKDLQFIPVWKDKTRSPYFGIDIMLFPLI